MKLKGDVNANDEVTRGQNWNINEYVFLKTESNAFRKKKTKLRQSLKTTESVCLSPEDQQNSITLEKHSQFIAQCTIILDNLGNFR